VPGELWRERTGALAKFGNYFEVLVDFLSGLGPICKYFLETEGPAVTSQKHRDHWFIYNKLSDLIANLHGKWKFPDYFPMENFVDRVHGAVDQRRGRVHGVPEGGADTANGGASSGHGTRALEVTGGDRGGRARHGYDKERWLELGARAKEGKRGLRTKGERCGVL
jgi:hypothetical protein